MERKMSIKQDLILTRARRHAIKGEFERAFQFYLEGFDLCPEIRTCYEEDFRTIVLQFNNILADQDLSKFIFMNIKHALEYFPNSVLFRNDLGLYSFKYRLHEDAFKNFEEALRINPKFVDAERNLNSVKKAMIGRWHYRMLNDNIRNESYRRAIHERLFPSEGMILDVATGTGLLAIYAAETSSRNVIGCDGSHTICELAKEILSQNDIKNLTIVNQLYTKLNFLDYGGKFSVLLTEAFDAGLLGEQVLQMLSYAWAKLLTRDAAIIPFGAQFFVFGAQCDHLNRKYQLCSETKQLLNIPFFNVHIITDNKTYNCEDVHLNKDFKHLTESSTVFSICFNDPEEVQYILEKTEPCKVHLHTIANGVMNVVVGWFELYLSNSVTITTSPSAFNRTNAWQQAIFFDNIPKAVKENEIIETSFLLNGGRLTMAQEPNTYIARVSDEMLRFLNDTYYLKHIAHSVSNACQHLKIISPLTQIRVADLCPFPYFGLQMLMKGAKSLLCCAKNEYDKKFLEQVFRVNQVPKSKVTIIIGSDWWTADILINEKFHVIFNHEFDMCGETDVRIINIGKQMKQKHLVKWGLFLPFKIQLITQIISSRWVDINNRLYDENVSNYKMAHILNKYSGTQNFNIDLNTLKYVPMSQPIIVEYSPVKEVNYSYVTTTTEGYANALLCWYSIKLMYQMEEIFTNRSNSFMDGMLFLTNFRQKLAANTEVRIVEYRDKDECFKLELHPGVDVDENDNNRKSPLEPNCPYNTMPPTSNDMIDRLSGMVNRLDNLLHWF